jgi:hypothetical protein
MSELGGQRSSESVVYLLCMFGREVSGTSHSCNPLDLAALAGLFTVEQHSRWR